MPRQPRSKGKTTPEFDPGELADLIHTPAVGTGVSSHLLDRHPPPPLDGASLSQPVTIVDKLTTVDKSGAGGAAAVAPALDLTTVVAGDVSTVGKSASATVVNQEMTTVVSSHSSTVAKSNQAAVDSLDATIVALSDQTVPNQSSENLSTVDDQDLTTVVNPATVDRLPPTSAIGPLWVSDDGAYIPPRKVRRVRFAQDALSSAEQAVYDLLWNQPPTGSGSEAGNTGDRLAQAGYDFIVKRTGLSKKTVQRLIAKLIDKDFIAIEVPADIYTRTSTTYRVYSQRAVLDRMTAKNRLFVAKVGPGVVHVRQAFIT